MAAEFYRRQLCPSKKRGDGVGKTKRSKGSRTMALVSRQSRPLALSVFSATPFESTLLEQTIKERFSKTKIGRVVADRAYDSDPLDKRLNVKGIELIAPHKRNRKKKKTHDGPRLRPYKKRWTVERFLAWLQNFRRCLVRWERKLENFQAFLYLAAIIMLLRYF